VQAAEAIGCIAPADASDAVACLVEELHPADQDVRNRNTVRLMAIYALRKIGPPAKSAVPALLDLMRSLKNRFAVDAAVTAMKIDPANAGEAYDAFRARLRPDVAPDESWLDQIDELGKNAKPLVPELIAALKSKHASHRSAALNALKMLGPDAAEALPALRDVTKDGVEKLRAERAIRAIEAKKK
jgi:HEAT repeat protein